MNKRILIGSMSAASVVMFVACSGANQQDVLNDPIPGVDASMDVSSILDHSLVDTSSSSVDGGGSVDAQMEATVPCVSKFCQKNSCGLIDDGCNPHPLDCGSCSSKKDTCISNTCVPPFCNSETDQQFCSRLNAVCGNLSATDNCGMQRVVAECGACPAATPVCLKGQKCVNNLIDHNGRVMATMNLYVIYWGTGFSVTTQALYQSFLTGLGSSSYAAINTQYLRGAPNLMTYVSAFSDIKNQIPVTATDLDLHSEIDRLIADKSLPYDTNGFYLVVTPKTTKVCFGPGFCACTEFCGYHSSYTDTLGRSIIYATIPSAAPCPGGNPGVTGCGTTFFTDATSPNGNVEADEGVSIMAHEIMEAQSDALVDAWYDSSIPLQENGDKCGYQYGVAAGVKTNQSWGGKSWLVQQNWSNTVGGCVSN